MDLLRFKQKLLPLGNPQDSGWGGGGTQTSIQDLPDWAKGTAKNVLGAAESTVFQKDPTSGKITGFQPYQQYGGQRTAQFTPLQQQAYGDAYNMDAGPQSFAQNIGTYMSPYQQNVIDREKMEAARTSQMLGQQQQAQATQAGAFGGYREGIQRAERERGLRSQMQDIQTRGSQAAFDRASDQFRQGVTQNLAIGQQQAQFGAQQQGQVQKALDTAYQDFVNQQKFPIQQIGYLSDILRGTPMGGTSTFYGGQGNTLGQIAGIGAGLYGMFGRAEGGMVDSYADGGVTSDDSVKGILDDLSIDQLKQSRQIAASSGDAARVQMIDEELAQRASEKRGMSSAFNSLPQEQQNAVTQMAGGGIVAFAGGGTGYFDPLSEMSGLDSAGLAADEVRRQSIIQGRKKEEESIIQGRKKEEEALRQEFLRQAAPQLAAPVAAAADKNLGPVPGTSSTTSVLGGFADARTGYVGKPGTSAPAKAPVAKAKPPAKNSGLAAAANAVATAAEATTGTPRTSMEAAFTQGLNMVRDTQGAADSQRMVDLINKISKVDAPDKMQMLSDFGFRMAAAASKPGARFLSAAAEGAQVVPETMAQYRKDKKEATKLGATLEVEKLKYDSAIRRGDRSAAMQHAQNIRSMEGQEAQLTETKRHNTATERNQAAQIAAQQARYAAAAAARKDQYTRIKAQLSQKAMTQATKDWKDDLTGKGVRAQYPSLQAYQKSLYDTMWAQSMPELKVLSEED
jgi:hypothetical protein